MATRLPTPGGDSGNWGEILNTYLLETHNPDGTLKNSTVTGAKLADNTITENKLATAVRDKLNVTGTGGATNLSTTTTAITVTVASDTGDDATLPAATTTAAGVLTAADKSKLNNVATNATANATDAQLRDRSTHTGSQAISTVTNLQTTLDGKAATSHTHTVADVTGLQGVLDDKADTSDLESKLDTANVAGNTAGWVRGIWTDDPEDIPPGTPVDTLVIVRS